MIFSPSFQYELYSLYRSGLKNRTVNSPQEFCQFHKIDMKTLSNIIRKFDSDPNLRIEYNFFEDRD
ncbi:MAG: hypothetical protein NZ529_11695, partial [Cytophagaceae bacterium]|nr:hypothetical protein [Cytophagaceae bacterium]MDW8457447.1 hypothetical protein [Cytophagaceae bacterium]